MGSTSVPIDELDQQSPPQASSVPIDELDASAPPAPVTPPSTVPRQNLDPIARAQQGQDRWSPAFSDVVGTPYTKPDRETQAAVARNTSPRAAASEQAGMPLADVAGKPQEPQGEEYINAAGLPRQRSAVPEADAVPVLDAWKGVEPLATGLSRVAENQSQVPKSPHFGPRGTQRFGTVPEISPEQQAAEETRRRQRSLGAAEIMQGSGELMTPVAVGSGLVNPVPVIAGYLAGYGASEGTGALVHGRVAPEDEEAIRAGAFFLPSVLGVAAGLKSGSVEIPQGKFSAAEILGGKVRAGVARTPDVISGRVKVGGTQFEVKMQMANNPGLLTSIEGTKKLLSLS